MTWEILFYVPFILVIGFLLHLIFRKNKAKKMPKWFYYPMLFIISTIIYAVIVGVVILQSLPPDAFD